MQYFQEQGHVIAYSRYGDPGNPAIVLLMGLGMPGACWAPLLVQKLVEEGFQVIVPDNRDVGESTHYRELTVDQGDVINGILNAFLGRTVTQAKYNLSDMAVDVVHLLTHLRIDSAHVVGFSMGGMIAQVLASNYPDSVRTLVSISSATGHIRTGLGKLTAIWSLIREPKEAERLEEYFQRVVQKLAGPLYEPTATEMDFMLTLLSRRPFDREAMYRQLLAILASGDRSQSLAMVRAPTLVIHGKSDPLLPFAAGEETAALIRGSTLWAIEGMGHQLPMKLMPQFGQRIALFCHRRV